ncbi:MAG: hypothetical protein B7Y28_12335 [Polaromonas sp. 16-63-31]|nr:MAG: hypothetical protein B7Y60_15255 [Polaromonas sp. 35-63-35]OYZ19319.1 MAG: hypothetical protein B7Y28_12335 [Polaromonas sp. 16-63-31]
MTWFPLWWSTTPSIGIRGIYKQDSVYMRDVMESTPIVFNWTMYAIIHKRSPRGAPLVSEVIIQEIGGKHIATLQLPGLSLISAFVDGGRVTIFASDSEKSDLVVSLSSADLRNWSKPETVLRAAPDQQILNTSVTRGPAGFVMAYEVQEKGVVGFTPRFATSPDMRNWTPVGEPFDRTRYAACPTLRHIDGWYYMLYLTILDEDNAKKRFVTVAARSRDLKVWQHATKPAFEPTGGEGINNSDVDMVQALGVTTFLYADGDQQDRVALKRAVYIGSEGDFFRQFEYADKRL